MIKIKLTHPDCMPKIGSEDAAGMDLRAFFNDLRAIAPGKSLMIDTGVAVEIPRGWFGLVVPRSSLGKRHLMIANTAGVIDSDYRGTIKMNLYNYGSEMQTLENFERLCQLVVLPHYSTHNFKIVDELEETIRGEGGFGSSGSK
uniref:Deoxyuridine 5'-triphosphate nucleotidohydrolase n=1 Tax=Escherichia phage T5 TaxID=2695836 RepID=UPI002D21EF0C|nr:Chain A, Deoxyuridine 5'-triphosphate nucleotidohydrolase [Escherichia phage T5]8QLD_B Chain B, Deoxyuridine 5'-triphosphate nucleotidohydrolase [Escherichia phage T5]8QLD_C Chain C, Deoxyuridine 5'-triphosphate nucleotidohydrolase [Escherichia phage T5]